MLSALLSAALAAAPAGDLGPSRPQTPWFLPRYAWAGAIINKDIVAPTVRVGWEIAVLDQPRNLLTVVVELGPAFALARPSSVHLFWEHVALAGLGYRWGKDKGFTFGFLVAAGPVLHGARYTADRNGAPVQLSEQRVLGWIEGRAYAGLRAGPVTLALGVGYGSSWNDNPYYFAARYLGGFTPGIYVNWR